MDGHTWYKAIFSRVVVNSGMLRIFGAAIYQQYTIKCLARCDQQITDFYSWNKLQRTRKRKISYLIQGKIQSNCRQFQDREDFVPWKMEQQLLICYSMLDSLWRADPSIRHLLESLQRDIKWKIWYTMDGHPWYKAIYNRVVGNLGMGRILCPGRSSSND